MNDLQITNIKVDYELPTLTYDLEPLKQQINAIKKQYENWVVVEDDLKSAKEIIASINKAEKAISNQRIAIVKEIKEPISEFEDEIKLLSVELKQLAQSIKDQTDVYEEQRKENKRKEILALENYADYIVFDERWLNKSVSMTDIQNDIDSQILSFSKNKTVLLTVIGDTMEVSKYVKELERTLDLEQTIALYKNDLAIVNKFKEEINEMNTATSEDMSDSDIIEPQEIFNASGIKYMRSLKINATKEQIALLKEFLTKYEIEYEVE